MNPYNVRYRAHGAELDGALGSPGPAWTITDLSWDFLYRPNYGGSPWAPSASSGSSGGNGNLTEATNPPAVSAALATKTGAQFNGSTHRLNNASVISTFLTDASGSICALVYVAGLSAGGASSGYYNEPAIFSDSANGFTAMSVSDQGLRMGSYDTTSGSFDAATAGVPTVGAWSLLQARWSSGVISARVNGAAWSNTSKLVTLSGDPVVVGKNYSSSSFFNGTIMEIGASKTSFSDADFNKIRTATNTTYGVSV